MDVAIANRKGTVSMISDGEKSGVLFSDFKT